MSVVLEQLQVVTVEALPAAILHVTVPRERIREVMGPGLEEVRKAIAAQGAGEAGPWFTHHLRMDPAAFDFEIGVPVSSPVAPAGRVMPGELPAARVARAVYCGPYERLGEAWGEFDAWVAREGHTARGDLWETYLTGPESGADPALFRTELSRPLSG
jgi:effector-binding domain-containing protein